MRTFSSIWLNRLVFFGACFVLNVVVSAQTNADYDSLVQQGKAQLQAGSTDVALASGEAAIKINADRWEAYALAGGADESEAL